jgi:hypothetical protein
LPKTFAAKATAEIKDLCEAQQPLEHHIDALEKGLIRA